MKNQLFFVSMSSLLAFTFTQSYADVRSAVEGGISRQEVVHTRPAQSAAATSAAAVNSDAQTVSPMANGAPRANLNAPTAMAQKTSKVESGANRSSRHKPREPRPVHRH